MISLKYCFSVMRAGLYAYICWLKNNKSLMFFMVFWPYITAAFLLGLGMLLGSIEEYRTKMNIANPVFYIVASGGIMVSSISIVDSVVGATLRHRWIGTLPYIVSSPPGFILSVMFGPIPDSMISSFIALTSILPIATYFEGIIGSLKIFIVLMVIYLAMIPLIGLSIIVAGLTLILGEETNIAAFLTPFMLLVAGVFYPQTILPEVLRALGLVIPLTYVVSATKLLATYHIPPFNALIVLMGFIAGLAIIYNSMSIPGIKAIERRVLKSGIQE